MIMLVLVLMVSEPDDAERSRRAEESAFVAVHAHRYCDAVTLFLEAQQLAPAPELLVDAAHAAELAGDRSQALALYTAAVADGHSDARPRLSALGSAIEREGAGASCAVARSVTTSVPVVIDAPAERAATDESWPVAAVGGGVLVVAGGTAAALAGATWMDHAAAQQELADRERSGAPDTGGAYARQVDAEQRWGQWGRPALVAGVVGAVAGAALLGVAGAMFIEEKP